MVIVDDELAAVNEDDRRGYGQDRAGQSAGEECHHLHGEKGVEEAAVATSKFFGFAVFVAGGDDEAHREKAFDKKTAEIGTALAERFRFDREARLVVAEGDDADRKQGDAGQKESPIQGGHDGKAANEEKNIGQYGQ